MDFRSKRSSDLAQVRLDSSERGKARVPREERTKVGWEVEVISHQQAQMLAMFEKGWGFKLFNDRPGSWCTYWSLIRRKLICDRKTVTHAGKPVCIPKLSEMGKKELLKHRKKLCTAT